MKYLGRPRYEATAEEIAALPNYHEASNQFGYKLPVGQYRSVSTSGGCEPVIIDVIKDPLEGTKEVFNRVRIVEKAVA